MSVAAGRRVIAVPRARTVPTWWRSLLVLVGQGLRDRRWAPLTWGGALGAMSALMAALWPSIEDSMARLVQGYPEGLKAAFGIDRLDTVERYVDAEMLSLIVPLALAFFAIRCVTGATVGAEERGHLDMLLSLPVARWVLVASAFVVAGLSLVAILAVVWALTWTVGTLAGTGISAATLAAGLVNVWPLAMAFAGLGVLLSGMLRGSARVTGIAAGTLVAMYVVDVVGKVADPLEPLRVASAFRYYGSAIQDGLDATHVAGLVAVGVALAALGAVLFERRDVR